MKIEKINNEKDPGYPSFNDHKLKRRGALKVICGGIATVLAAGCDLFHERRTAGEIAQPAPLPPGTPPKPLPLEQPVELDGEMVCPDPVPLEQPAGLVGEMISPEPPKLVGKPKSPKPPKELPLEQPVPDGGVVVMPEPPPRTKGRIAPVKPPATTPKK